MTFSILARDPQTGLLGGAAATGSLCVGGWVLRGHANSGLSASQGAAPSTLWGEQVLDAMRDGRNAGSAVADITSGDRGRSYRQLLALDTSGASAVFTGEENTPACAGIEFENGVAAGNMLDRASVIDAMVSAYQASNEPFAERLLSALNAARMAGGDMRGLQSAALLIVAPAMAPLTLRIDYGEAPLEALEDLYKRSQSDDYAHWATQVPTEANPERILD